MLVPSLQTEATSFGSPAFDHQALLLGVRKPAPKPALIPQPSQLTHEQRQVVDLAAEGESVSVNAFAGTGKTATAVAVAESLGQPGLYLAFGSAIAAEARRRFPSTFEVSTFHGLAYAQIGIARWCERAGRRLGEPSLHAFAELNGLGGPDGYLAAWRIREVLRRFYQSAGTQFGIELLSPEIWLSLEPGDHDVVGQGPSVAGLLLGHQLLQQAEAVWEALWRPDDPARLSIGHDAYLKRWAIGAPELPGQFHLVDEAQDCSPLMVEVLRQQTKPRVLLGDRHQSIFGFRGAVNAMACLPGERRALTRSFRFGACIEMVANHLLQLNGEQDWLIGESQNPGDLYGPEVGLESYLDRTDGQVTILTRTNSEALSLAVALVKRYPTAVLGGMTEALILLRSALALFEGRPQDVRDSRLRPFRSWQALTEHVSRSRDTELQRLINLVELRRLVLAEQLVDLEVRLAAEPQARVLISTIHKAKGREWDHVYLADDFRNIEPAAGHCVRRTEEINLLYVAVTRARRSLRLNVATQAVLDGV